MRLNKRFLYTLFLIIFVLVGTSVAVFLAKGYQFSTKTGTVAGTGIISVTSTPDQASVFLDGHLTTATNANINSLLPKNYDVKITKDGFIPWEKQVAVREGFVTQIKATLFPAIPTIYPLTFNGVEDINLSPDSQGFVFVVPLSADDSASQIAGETVLKKSGVWVWNMNSNPLPFAGGPEPHRIADLIPGIDYSKATVRWSPDSTQVLLSFPNVDLLMDANSFNNTGQDITAMYEPTLTTWNDEQKTKNEALLALIKDQNLRQQASSSALLKWSPDETKLLYSKDGQTNLKITDLVQNQTFNLGNVSSLSWLPDSKHLIMVEGSAKNSLSRGLEASSSAQLQPGKISILEFDGSNKSEIYDGNFDLSSVFAWPDSSRLVIISSVPTPTANIPNLFGINLK